LPKLLPTLDAVNAGIRSISVSRPSLDDVFLKYTGKAFTAEESSGGAWWTKWQQGGGAWGKQWTSADAEASGSGQTQDQAPSSAQTAWPVPEQADGGPEQASNSRASANGDWRQWAARGQAEGQRESEKWPQQTWKDNASS
jgi:hypothetical protein